MILRFQLWGFRGVRPNVKLIQDLPHVSTRRLGGGTFRMPYTPAVDEDDLGEYFRGFGFNPREEGNEMSNFSKGEVEGDILLCHLDDIVCLIRQF
jgi:hypothetical protein